MAKDTLERIDDQVAESIRRLTRATSAMADAIDESTKIIKHTIKRSGDAAEELLDDTTERIKRHPVETMAATFTLGVIVGGFLGWFMSRR